MNFSFEKLKEVLKPIEKVKLTLLIISMVLGAMLELIGIGVIMLFVSIAINIEVILENERIKPVLEFLSIDTAKEALIYGSFLLLLIFFLKNSYIIFHQYLKSRFVYNRYKFISNRLFSLYMKSPYYFHLKRNSADLIRNISIEAENLANRVIMPFLQIIAEGILVISIALMLFIIEPFITIFSIIFLGGVSLIFLKFIKKGVKNYGKKSFEERRKMIKVISEGIGGFKEISVLKRENWFINKMRINSDILSKSQIFQQVIERSVRPTMETIAVFGMLLVSFFLLQGDRVITSLFPTLVLFAFSVYRFLPALNNIINDYVRIKYHFRTIETIYDDLITEEKKEDIKEREYNFKKEITFENVSYSYPGGGIESLKNINFSIKKGSAVGIIGQTGSGKTTLIDIIAGLLLPTKGEIKIDGVSLEDMKKSFQKNIGYVPQSIYLSDDTITNNIAFGLDQKDIDQGRMERAIKTAFIDEFSNDLQDKLNTIVGERGVRLSGGQKQRIGIARALYRDPEILILDEATSSLDGITEKYVIKAIEELKKDRTIIMIAHRLTTVKGCDIIYILKDGEIVDSGSYNTLIKKNEYFKSMAE